MSRRSLIVMASTMVLMSIAGPGAATFPGANGRLVVVRIVRDSGWVVTTMEPDGSDPRRVYTLDGFRYSIQGVDWSRDATRLAVNPCCGEQISHSIVSIAADGSDPRGLLRKGSYPAWSHDGSQIAFQKYGQLDGRFKSWIFVADADGSNVSRFTAERSARALYPAWSPDGTRIAFIRSMQGFVIKPVSGGSSTVIALPDGVVVAEQLEWAPDGSALTFIGYSCFGDCADVWTVDAAGTTFTRLTHTPRAVETDADWSPDGSTIAYVRFTDPGFGSSDLWFMDADGSNKRALETKRLEFFVDWATT